MAASSSEGAAGAVAVRAGEFVALRDGVRLWVERCGSGTPVLLIPGLGAGTWLWDGSASALAERFLLIMPELRGGGRSDKPDERYSVEGFADDMCDLLDRLHIDGCHVVGVSLGGFVAQLLAVRLPTRVHRLVLAATTVGGAAQVGPTGDVLARLIRPHGRTRRERLEDAYELGFTPAFRSARPDLMDRITAWRLAHPQPESAYYRQLLAGYGWAGPPDSIAIEQPTLICAGRDDVVVPPANARLLATSIPNSRVLEFDGRHLFFLEHAEAFAAAVTAFLEEPV